MSNKNCGCGNDCTQECPSPNTCPSTIDASSFDTWDINDDGNINDGAWVLMFMPKTQDGCSWIPYKVRFKDLKKQFSSWCFGDVKMSATSNDNAMCGDRCWVKMDGSKVLYYNDAGDHVDTFVLPNMSGKTPVMPDANNYFGTGITALGNVVGEAKHLQQSDEVGEIDVSLELHISFDIPIEQDAEGGGNNHTWDTGAGANNQHFTTDGGSHPINTNGSKIVNNATEPKAFNVMQPSFGMNFFMYICKDDMEHAVEAPTSDDSKAPAGYFTDNQAQNNNKPWYK